MLKTGLHTIGPGFPRGPGGPGTPAAPCRKRNSAEILLSPEKYQTQISTHTKS